MKIVKILQELMAPAVSFEVMPPIRGRADRNIVEAVITSLARYNPPFIDVTSRPAEPLKKHEGRIERTRPGTLGLCGLIKEHGIEPVPHVLCKGFTREETEDFLIDAHLLGIDNVLAVRGENGFPERDLAKGRSKNIYTSDLANQIRDMNSGKYLIQPNDPKPTSFCIGVGCYPEKHPEAPDLETDILNFKRKVDASASYAITQLFLDNSAYFSFVERCRKAGITIPIIPGIRVLTKTDHLTSIPGKFQANIPEELIYEVMHASNPEQVREIGIAYAVKQARELLDHKVPLVHFYVIQDPEAVIRVVDKLK